MTDMTIKAVRTTMLRVPWPDTPWLKGHAFGDARNILVLEVETKGGIVGMGYLLLFRLGIKSIMACLEELIIPRVIGKDASAVEAIWQDLWRATITYGRAGIAVMAMSALDIALWDVARQSGPTCRCIDCGDTIARNCRLTALAASAARAATA